MYQALTGMENLGNTCFINAVIQCLGWTLPLSVYFTTGKSRKVIRNGNHSMGEVAEEFAAVVWSLWTGVHKSVSPRKFMNILRKNLSICAGYEQQDSHEFLIILLNRLHGDLNKPMSSQPAELLHLDDLPVEDARRSFWSNHTRMNNSIISELFEGFMQSTLQCLRCNFQSNSFEVMSFLSIPVISSKVCYLTDCLDLFLKPETMSGDGAWHCPQCQQKQDARKCTTICHLPEILVIHLKRFLFQGIWTTKLKTYVKFPFKLQMNRYVPESLAEQTQSYHLYGIVNHYGSMERGHYTAFCKSAAYDRWYKYDDDKVSAMTENEVK